MQSEICPFTVRFRGLDFLAFDRCALDSRAKLAARENKIIAHSSTKIGGNGVSRIIVHTLKKLGGGGERSPVSDFLRSKFISTQLGNKNFRLSFPPKLVGVSVPLQIVDLQLTCAKGSGTPCTFAKDTDQLRGWSRSA